MLYFDKFEGHHDMIVKMELIVREYMANKHYYKIAATENFDQATIDYYSKLVTYYDNYKRSWITMALESYQDALDGIMEDLKVYADNFLPYIKKRIPDFDEDLLTSYKGPMATTKKAEEYNAMHNRGEIVDEDELDAAQDFFDENSYYEDAVLTRELLEAIYDRSENVVGGFEIDSLRYPNIKKIPVWVVTVLQDYVDEAIKKTKKADKVVNYAQKKFAGLDAKSAAAKTKEMLDKKGLKLDPYSHEKAADILNEMADRYDAPMKFLIKNQSPIANIKNVLQKTFKPENAKYIEKNYPFKQDEFVYAKTNELDYLIKEPLFKEPDYMIFAKAFLHKYNTNEPLILNNEYFPADVLGVAYSSFYQTESNNSIESYNQKGRENFEEEIEVNNEFISVMKTVQIVNENNTFVVDGNVLKNTKTNQNLSIEQYYANVYKKFGVTLTNEEVESVDKDYLELLNKYTIKLNEKNIKQQKSEKEMFADRYLERLNK